jgi:hypothetical protein
MSMDSQKLPVGQGSGFIWDKAGHIVTNWCAFVSTWSLSSLKFPLDST